MRILSRPHSRLSPNPRTILASSKSHPTTSTNDGFLARPWKRITRRHAPEAIYVFAKRNYKVHANLCITRRNTRSFVTVLDTGAGSSFIRKDIIPQSHWPLIQILREAVQIRDAGNRTVNVAGRITLAVELGNHVEALSFYVVGRLSTQVLLGCDFATNTSKRSDRENGSLN